LPLSCPYLLKIKKVKLFVESFKVEVIVTLDKGVMRNETDLEQLQQRVEKAKTLVHQSGIKVEELEASIRYSRNFKDDLIIYQQKVKSDSTEQTEVSPNDKSHLLKTV
jgi:hypothetical protein